MLFGNDTPLLAEHLPADVAFLGDRQQIRIETSSVFEFDRDCSSLVTSLSKHYGSVPDVDPPRQLEPRSDVEHRLANTVWNFPGTETKVTFQPDHQVDFDDIDATGYWELQGDHLQFD